ncbi:hypothetical protein RRSWK_01261 [Rhodopirellula sp. SWK7]|nr:hypothetical protein RRSWK_01261 [Rhodopirellula sp. SWK7]
MFKFNQRTAVEAKISGALSSHCDVQTVSYPAGNLTRDDRLS